MSFGISDSLAIINTVPFALQHEAGLDGSKDSVIIASRKFMDGLERLLPADTAASLVGINSRDQARFYQRDSVVFEAQHVIGGMDENVRSELVALAQELYHALGFNSLMCVEIRPTRADVLDQSRRGSAPDTAQL